jgi:hypothetical protein
LTFAELLLLVAGVTGIYVLLRPFQQWLEGVWVRTFSGRRPHGRRTTIDVTDFRSYPPLKKEDEEHEDHGS